MPSPIDIMEKNLPVTPAPEPTGDVRVPGAPRAIADYNKPDAAPSAETAKPQYVREWQLTDEDGKPVGPPSRIEATSADELADKLVDANKTAVLKLAEYRKKYRGAVEAGQPLPKFEPKSLTTEEKIALRKKLDNPTTQEQGFDELFTARVGISPDAYRAELTRQLEDERARQAYDAGVQFLREHPDFDQSKTNDFMDYIAEKQTALRVSKGDPNFTIATTKENMGLLYEDAISAGRMIPKLVTSQESAPKELVAPVTVPPAEANTSTEETVRTRQRGTRHESMAPGHSSVAPGMSQATDDAAFRQQVNAMPREELKRRIKTDIKFRQRLDALKPA